MAITNNTSTININFSSTEAIKEKEQSSTKVNSLLAERLRLNQTLLEILVLHVEFSGCSDKNTFIPFNNLSVTQNTDVVSTQEKIQLYNNLIAIDESYLDKLSEVKLKSKQSDEGNVSGVALLTKANQFLQVIASQDSSFYSGNIEDDILDALKEAVDVYAERLEDIQKWTEGGLAAFEVMLEMMFEGIIANEPLTTEDYENLLQLLVLDLLINAKEYGLEEWMNEGQTKDWTSHILEVVGSGNHSTHPGQQGWENPEQIADSIEAFLYALLDEIDDVGALPEDSLAAQILVIFEDAGIGNICDDIEENFNEDWGGIDTATDYSPMLRLSILSEIMEHYPLSQEQVDIFLTGSKEEVDALVNEITGVDYESAFHFLVDADDSEWVIRQDPDSELGWAVDYLGDGIDYEVLVALYENFPPRDLTDEEIEEINRIGDAVKMLMETMKYWIQICADNQMAMARNI
ncbi:hypothetical protein [Vibrio coralliilyticus]|uniref:hypothetical protein n=1 Tax=Vibrio coralliilyticus TaxID=190893 RepID=UPI0017CAD6D5|nr:hypothetical protein [Vibrio coralliilyticus]NUW68085.1 hypothetical protein [Vibrio coralliilyticus]